MVNVQVIVACIGIVVELVVLGYALVKRPSFVKVILLIVLFELSMTALLAAVVLPTHEILFRAVYEVSVMSAMWLLAYEYWKSTVVY